MTDISTILDDIYEALPQSRATLTLGDDTIERVTIVGVDRELRDSDQGMYAGADAMARYRLTLEPAAWSVGELPYIIGKLVTTDTGTTYRVAGRAEHMGCVRLSLIQTDEER